MIKQKSSEMGVSKKEKRGLVITEIFMILLAAVWFIPIYYLIVTTFKNPQEATQSPLGRTNDSGLWQTEFRDTVG